MEKVKTYLVFGATGQTGRHFVAKVLADGHRVRAVVRDRGKLIPLSEGMEIHEGSITDELDLDSLVKGVDYVVAMIGNGQSQKTNNLSTDFVMKLVPAMRRQGVKRFLFQAGAFSSPPDRNLSPIVWLVKYTLSPRSLLGQHRDNAMVMRYLYQKAPDIEWMVHRAAVGSDGESKGRLHRSARKLSIGTFVDCATYNYLLLDDKTAIHTCDVSVYAK